MDFIEVDVRAGFAVVCWQAEVERLINTVTDDLLNQSQSVHLRRIVTVNEEGEEREKSRVAGGGRRKPAGSGDVVVYQAPNVCRDLRGF